MIVLVAALLIAGALLWTLGIRAKDLPAAPPVSPTQHLEERKAQIYENLRDLQFEYRLGKLSDEDYQKTKVGLQTELAKVLADIDLLKPAPPQAAAQRPAGKARVGKGQPDGARTTAAGTACPHCGAKFDRALKFCGECGKAMAS